MTFFVVNPGFPRTLRSAKKQSATALLCKAVVTEPIHHFLSDSVRPQRRQPTRLPRPWDSPGKNTGVGCHFLLQCMKVKSESEVVQSCPTLSDPMDCSFPGPSVHGIFQARVLTGVGCHCLLQIYHLIILKSKNEKNEFIRLLTYGFF